MKAFFAVVVLALVAVPAFAVPRLCYDSLDGGQFCTDQNVGKVQVLVYNAGWCPPCNEEMAALPAISKQFKGDEVVFASLSGEGWTHKSQPDKAFLKAWRQKHGIPFVVAGKYRDFGQSFNSPGYIPFAVVLDAQGNVAKSGNMSASEIGQAVQDALGGY